jgi:hypothetical protein
MKISKNLIFTIIITAIVFGGGGFYGGMFFGKSQTPGRLPNGQFVAGVRDGSGNALMRRQGSNFVNGDVIAKDDKSITVQNRDGGSKIIFFSDKTTITKSASGTKEDLAEGTTVIATGTANSDGTMTAQNIQIAPAGGTMFGGPRDGQGPPAGPADTNTPTQQ